MPVEDLPKYFKEGPTSTKLEKFSSFWLKYKLSIIVGFMLFIFASIMLLMPKETPSLPADTSEPDSKNAFFDPTAQPKERSLSGKIRKVKTTDENVNFALVNGSKIEAYILSRNHDLGLSESLDVVVTGTFVKKFDGYDLIDVETIKLK